MAEAMAEGVAAEAGREAAVEDGAVVTAAAKVMSSVNKCMSC